MASANTVIWTNRGSRGNSAAWSVLLGGAVPTAFSAPHTLGVIEHGSPQQTQ